MRSAREIRRNQGQAPQAVPFRFRISIPNAGVAVVGWNGWDSRMCATPLLTCLLRETREGKKRKVHGHRISGIRKRFKEENQNRDWSTFI